MSELEETWRIFSFAHFLLQRGKQRLRDQGLAQVQNAVLLHSLCWAGAPWNPRASAQPLPHWPWRHLRGWGGGGKLCTPASTISSAFYLVYILGFSSVVHFCKEHSGCKMFNTTIIYHDTSFKKEIRKYFHDIELFVPNTMQIAQMGLGLFSLFYRWENKGLGRSNDLIYIDYVADQWQATEARSWTLTLRLLNRINTNLGEGLASGVVIHPPIPDVKVFSFPCFLSLFLFLPSLPLSFPSFLLSSQLVTGLAVQTIQPSL